MTTFSNLSVGNNVYIVEFDTKSLNVSEISKIVSKDIYSTLITYAEFGLYPIIGDWQHLWFTKEEYESESFFFGGAFFTTNENEALRIFSILLKNENI